MRIILKILLFPIVLCFAVVLGFLKFVIGLGNFASSILSALIGMSSFVFLFSGDFISFFIFIFIAYLLSPQGLQSIGRMIVNFLDSIYRWLKRI